MCDVDSHVSAWPRAQCYDSSTKFYKEQCERTWIEEYQIFQRQILGILKKRVISRLWRGKDWMHTCQCSWRKSFTHCKYLSANFFTAGFWMRLMLSSCPLACKDRALATSRLRARGATYADNAVRTGFFGLLTLFPDEINDQYFNPGRFQ